MSCHPNRGDQIRVSANAKKVASWWRELSLGTCESHVPRDSFSWNPQVMKTLTSPCSKPIFGNNRDRGFSSFQHLSLTRAQVCLLPSKKLARIRFLHLVSVQRRRLQPLFSSSSFSPDLQACYVLFYPFFTDFSFYFADAHLHDSQGELETAETQPKEHNSSKATRVKFQLKKECSFGEHFFIVGDHPMLGSWDPESCIPLTWSEGHVWAVELDIPVGISVQFKFILKTTSGDILWQPGPDRIYKSLETENMIVVSEDWEAADYQEVLKEELQALSEELATGNGVPSLDKPFAIVAENPSYPTEDFMANKNAEALGMNRTKYANNEAMAIANKNVVVAEDLTPLSTVATEEEMLDEDDKNSTSDTSVGVDEAKCDELSEVMA
ncbi:hypothetical protein CXB51_029580 [Gossypium anomalum]|uniref:CBM20 domain-containing protein n=1 Tax=Gossypium anomalum TaxID=47600 RepID=A0A8J5YPC0_9ROSI|nr:hypothetical protein CXB51_029580 [Gossypium anomalum]